MQGLVASFDTSDLLTVNIFVQQRLVGIQGPTIVQQQQQQQQNVFAPPIQFAEVANARKPAIVPSADTPLPPPAKVKKQQQQQQKEFRPSKGNAAIRIYQDETIGQMSFKEFSDKIRELLQGLEITRIIKGEQVQHKVEFQFTLLDKNEEDFTDNTALIVFPYGCMDYCKAAFPLIKKEFESAKIYTGGVKRGQWE